MTVQPKATEHQSVGFLTNDQFTSSAGHAAISNMRQMLKRSSAASHYDSLDLKARSVICYAAKLRPSDFAHKRLDEMNDEQREAIRTAIITIKSINDEMANVSLDRVSFIKVPKQEDTSESIQLSQSETKRRLELSSQARMLAARAERLSNQIRNQEIHGA